MTFHTGLSRDGPALLVRDLLREETLEDLSLIAKLAPDIVALQNVDFDHDQYAASLIQERLRELGHAMPHRFTARPNTGIDSGFDLDRNQRLGEPRDMLGYAEFAGQGGMLILSRFPVRERQSKDLSAALWRDEGAQNLPAGNYFSNQELDVLPLHSVGAWDVQIETPDGPIHVLTTHASTPAFDGPEDRNGLRNAAQLTFWRRYIEQSKINNAPFVLLGTLNNDPTAGEGLKPALNALLGHELLQNPVRPEPTALWSSGLSLQVDYILASRGFGIRAAKVERAFDGAGASRHFPVWVDVIWQ
ncbi:MAG: endonuclease/exonuclease/phosphatase family protein [Litoreibacter sp.]|uniref:endonuclease/exonuclease/phosphatase family protein n=1 Tax=Litoreibacter sp. TaxID=1969459 RepID=UPI0032988A3A